MYIDSVHLISREEIKDQWRDHILKSITPFPKMFGTVASQVSFLSVLMTLSDHSCSQ